MNEIKTVGVKELKNKLSAYLHEVRSGVRILVSDRDTVIAELHEPQWDRPPAVSGNQPLSEWVKSRAVRLPSAEKKRLQPSPVRLEDGISLRLLNEGRKESGK